MTVENAFTYTFHWITMHVDACPKCQALRGRTWTGQDLFQSQLIDSQFGPVWDLDQDKTLAHPNCRCKLEVEVYADFSRIESLNKLVGMRHRFSEARQ